MAAPIHWAVAGRGKNGIGHMMNVLGFWKLLKIAHGYVIS